MQAKIHYSNETFGGTSKDFLFPLPESVTQLGEHATLEYIFRECNHVDGKEWIANQNLRSMCVGDTVELEGKIWKCDPVGWTQIV